MGELVAGVDLGGTKIQVVVVEDAAGEAKVLGQCRRETPRTTAADVIAEIVAATREAAGSRDFVAVGIGTPGSVDVETGHVSLSSNVPGFMDDVALGPLVSEGLGGVPSRVDNDVRVATVGEYRHGAGRPFSSLLGVFVGTGVGGGLVLDGNLRVGRGSAGEIGHTMVQPGGRRCPCGRRGCLEAYAGRLSIERAARHQQEKGHKTKLFEIQERKGRDRVTSAVIAEALEAGDKVTRDLIDQAVVALGVALSNAQNLLDLEAIILGGGLGDRLGEPFVRRVQAAMTKNLRDPLHPPALLTTELADLSGAVGAATIAADAVVTPGRSGPAPSRTRRS